jgi:hypothetical protein
MSQSEKESAWIGGTEVWLQDFWEERIICGPMGKLVKNNSQINATGERVQKLWTWGKIEDQLWGQVNVKVLLSTQLWARIFVLSSLQFQNIIVSAPEYQETKCKIKMVPAHKRYEYRNG